MSISESKDRFEKIMEEETEQKVQVVHKWIHSFELRILEMLAPTIDMSPFESQVANLWVDFDDILAT